MGGRYVAGVYYLLHSPACCDSKAAAAAAGLPCALSAGMGSGDMSRHQPCKSLMVQVPTS